MYIGAAIYHFYFGKLQFVRSFWRDCKIIYNEILHCLPIDLKWNELYCIPVIVNHGRIQLPCNTALRHVHYHMKHTSFGLNYNFGWDTYFGMDTSYAWINNNWIVPATPIDESVCFYPLAIWTPPGPEIEISCLQSAILNIAVPKTTAVSPQHSFHPTSVPPCCYVG